MIGGAVEDVVLDGPRAVVPAGGTLPGEVLLTGPEVVGQHPSGIQVASKWHPNGIQVASKWHPSGIQVYVRMRRRTLKPRASSGWW